MATFSFFVVYNGEIFAQFIEQVGGPVPYGQGIPQINVLWNQAQVQAAANQTRYVQQARDHFASVLARWPKSTERLSEPTQVRGHPLQICYEYRHLAGAPMIGTVWSGDDNRQLRVRGVNGELVHYDTRDIGTEAWTSHTPLPLRFFTGWRDMYHAKIVEFEDISS